MEAAQVVLLLVVAVAIILAIWLIMSGMLGSVNAPVMQYDAADSYAADGNTILYIKTGVSVSSVSNIQLSGPTSATCYAANIAGTTTTTATSTTTTVSAGGYITFLCDSYLAPGYYVLRFTYNAQNGNGGQQATIKFYWAGG
jgi:hypothetical protein